MKLINKERQTGKTTGLIYTSEATGYPILTKNAKTAQYISKAAKKMGCVIPEPMAVADYIMQRRLVGQQMSHNVLIDEVEDFLSEAIDSYINGHVVAATITLPMSARPQEETG